MATIRASVSDREEIEKLNRGIPRVGRNASDQGANSMGCRPAAARSIHRPTSTPYVVTIAQS